MAKQLTLSARDDNVNKLLEQLVKQVESLGVKLQDASLKTKLLEDGLQKVEFRVKSTSGVVRTYSGTFDQLAKSINLADMEQKKFAKTAEVSFSQSMQSIRFLSQYKKDLGLDTSKLDPTQYFRLAQAGNTLKDFLTKNKVTGAELAAAQNAFESKDPRFLTGPERGRRAEILSQLLQYKDAVKAADAELKRLQPTIEETKKKVDDFGISWNTVFRLYTIQLLHRALSATIQELRVGVAEAIKLQVSIAEIQTIDTGRSPFDTWLQGLRKLSDTFGTTLPDQTEAAYQALSNQVVESAAAFDLLGTKINEFALATKSTAADSIELITGALNAYGKTTADTEDVLAKFFKTIELGRVRAEEIANTYGRVLVPASQLGVTFEEVNAAMTLMTIQGVKANEAMTFLRNIFQKLIRPTEEMKKFYQELGVASGEAAIATFGLSGFMQKLEERTGGSSTEIGELFGRIRAITGAMMFSRGNLERYNSDLQAINQSTEDYNRAVDLVLNNLGKRIQIEGQQISNFFTVDLGNSVLKAADGIPYLVDNLDLLIKSLTTLGGIAAAGAIGVLLTKLSALGKIGFAGLTGGAIGIGAAALVGLYVSIANASDNLVNSIEEAALAQAKLYSEDTRRAIEAQTKAAKDYDAVINSSIRNELKKLSERDKLYQAAINNRKELAKSYDKLVTNDLQALDKLINDFTKKTKENIDKIVADREKLAKLNPAENVADAINNARLAAIPKNNFGAQVNFLTQQLAQLNEAQKRAALAGDLAQFEKISDKIEDTLDKLQQVQQARAQEFNLNVNLAGIENQRNAQLEKRLELLKKVDEALLEQQAREEERLQDEKEYESYLRGIADLVKGFNVDEIANAETQEELAKIVEKREIAYKRLQAAISGNLPKTFEAELKNLEERHNIEKQLAANKLEALETEAMQTKLMELQNKLVKDRANIDAQRVKTQELNTGLSALVAGIVTATNTGPFTNIKKEDGRFVRVGDKTIYNPEKLKELIDSLNKLSSSGNIKDALTAITILGQMGVSGAAVEKLRSMLDELIPLAGGIDKSAEQQFKATEEQIAKLTQQLQQLNPAQFIVKDSKNLETLVTLVEKIATNMLRPPGFASGGFVPGFGSGDVVPAMLTPGEFVMNKNAAMKFKSQLIAMNSGINGYSQGGEVINVGGISVTVSGGNTASSTVEEIAKGINRAIRTKRIRLRQ